MNQNDNLLKNQYLKILFPLMFSVLGGTINALIDSVIVSQRLGGNGLAAVNASMPMYLFLCTIGSLLCGGAWILSSKYLGKEKIKEANEVYNNGLCWVIIVGIAIMVLGVILHEEVAGLLGGDISIYEYVRQYILVSFYGALPCMLIYIPMYYLQLEGKGKQISITVAIMVASDFCLDILLLFVFNMGMYGAALASVIANVLCCIYGFLALHKQPSNFSISKEAFRPAGLMQIIKNGYPVCLGNLFDAVKLLILNLLILYQFGSRAMALWAILNTILELSLVISSGVARAANSMLSVYMSAMENSRIRMLIKIQIEIGIILSVIFGILLSVFCKPIGLMFSTDEFLLLPFIMVGLTTILHTVSDIWSGYFQITDMAWISGIQSLFRRLLFPILALLIVLYFGMEMYTFLPLGAFLTLFFSYLLTFIVSVRSSKTDRPRSSILLLDDYLSNNNKVIDFSLNANMEEACTASEQISDFCTENHLQASQSMKIQIAIEELIKIIIGRSENVDKIDARAYAYEDVIGIQFRYPGKLYNPFEDEDEDLFIELNMIKKLGEEKRHTYTLGLNTINFCLYKEKDDNTK